MRPGCAVAALVVAMLFGEVLHAQDNGTADPAPAAPPAATDLWARYQKLDKDQRELVVRNLERRLQRQNSDILQRIQDRQRGETAYPAAADPVWFDQKTYAPTTAVRHLEARGTSAHRAGTQQMHALEFLPDLHAAVVYDWGVGQAVRVAPSLSGDDRFDNIIHGYAPFADEAVAQILAALDNDLRQRLIANYFEHLYADRGGTVYAGVSLFTAWQSGHQVEMPDADAVAFARLVLKDSSITSPIPDGSRQKRLYELVRQEFVQHREYRTLRLAAAAAFVAAEPPIDSTYMPLVRRSQWLWVQCEWSPKQFAARLAKAKDRATWLTEIDAAIRATPDTIDATRQAFLETSDFLRRLADYELGRAGV